MAFTLIDLAGGAGGAGDINVNIALQEKTVDSSTETQHVVPTDGYIGIKDVIVNPYVLDSSNAVITENGEYVFESAADGLSRVDVSVNIPGPGAPLQSKTVDSSTKSQLVEPDSGNYGLSSVTVNPYTLDSSSLVATENGEYIITSSADGLSRVDVSVNFDTQPYYDEGYSAGEGAGISEGIAQQKAKLDKTTFTSNGTYTREDGWNEVTVDVPGVNNQDKVVDPSTNTQIITFDSGYTGIGQLTLNPYTLDEKTVDSSTNPQVITSDADGLSKVTINPYVLSPLEVDSSTAIQEITGQFGTVTVDPYTLQYKAKELEPSYRNDDSRGAVVKVEPDDGYDGLSAFQYRLPSILTSKTFDASTGNQTYVTNTANTYVKGINKIVINGLDLDSCYTLAASI